LETLSEKDEHSSHSGVEFVPVHYKIILENILEPVLPELNDELAKQFGASSLSELKAKMRKKLEKSRINDAESHMRNQASKLLLSKYRFEFPKVEADTARQVYYDSAVRKIESNRFSPSAKMEISNRLVNLLKQLEEHYHLMYIARQLAKDLNLTISKEELQKRVMHELLLSRTAPECSIDEEMKPEHIQALVYDQLLLNKVLGYITSKALAAK
jgi:trigger factor